MALCTCFNYDSVVQCACALELHSTKSINIIIYIQAGIDRYVGL